MPLFPCADLELLPVPRHVFFIVNPLAGVGQAETVREALIGLAGADAPHTVVVAQGPGHVRALAREAAATAGVDRVAVVGGDGTVMEALTGLVGTRMPLVVIPAGTGNVIAVETTMPGDRWAAVSVALGEAGVVPFDLGWSGG